MEESQSYKCVVTLFNGFDFFLKLIHDTINAKKYCREGKIKFQYGMHWNLLAMYMIPQGISKEENKMANKETK